MNTSHTEKSCAYQMRIVDTDLQAYLQQYPFATGPDHERNLAGREAIRQTLQARQPGISADIVLLTQEQILLPANEMRRLRDFFLALQYSPARQRILLDDFAWEANLVPRTVKSVLDIGCGDGMELVFLRAILPQAKITAIDYHDSLTPEVKSIADFTLFKGDIKQHLSSLTGGYDLIFSNHTLEHLYLPDEMIQKLYSLLTPGGSLISTLPMDANPGSPFLDKVARIAGAKTLHPLDVVFLDAGHPWKTNPPDLNRTLSEAGFGQIRIYQRAQHLSRPVAGGRLRFEAGKNAGLALNALFFGTAHAFIKLIVPKQELARINRILLAIERRVWFGSNNLKNYYTEEVLVHATKSF